MIEEKCITVFNKQVAILETHIVRSYMHANKHITLSVKSGSAYCTRDSANVVIFASIYEYVIWNFVSAAMRSMQMNL